jgi:hypothetical protein
MTGCNEVLNLRIFCNQGWIGGLPINKPDQALNPESLIGQWSDEGAIRLQGKSL